MSDRVYMGCAGHFIGGRSCGFHLNTYLPAGYIVSTVGDYRPSFSRQHMDDLIRTGSKEPIRARRDDEGPEEIGFERFFETMVFRAVKGDTRCCPWVIESGDNIDFDGYKTRDEAAEGHEAMCRKWEAVASDPVRADMQRLVDSATTETTEET